MAEDDKKTTKKGWGGFLEDAKRLAETAAGEMKENAARLKEAAEASTKELQKSEVWSQAKKAAEKASSDLKESETWAQTKKAAEAAAADVKKAAQKTAEEIKETEVWAQAKQAAETAKERIATAAGDATEKAQQVRDEAKQVITTLQSAPDDANNREQLLKRFVETIPIIRTQFDKEADALAVGYLGEAGIGIAGLIGVEILYLRGDKTAKPQLRVSRLEGKAARLAVGASTAAYVACLYGKAEALAHATARRGGDVDVFLASISFFRATNTVTESKATGWAVGLGAGLALGIPILSNVTALDFEEQILGRFTLEQNEIKRIEEALGELEDRSTRRKIAKSL